MNLKPGFSLLEILVALAVIALLSLLTIPVVNSVLRASGLTTSGRELLDQCVLARQIAQSKNSPVEVRLYKLPDYDADATATPKVFRAFQLFIAGETKAPLTKPMFFRAPVVLLDGIKESALLADANNANSPHKLNDPLPTDPPVGQFGNKYQYVAFQFLPSGATDLSALNNYLTLVLQNDKSVAQGGNYYTIQIDALNGSVRSFRP